MTEPQHDPFDGISDLNTPSPDASPSEEMSSDSQVQTQTHDPEPMKTQMVAAPVAPVRASGSSLVRIRPYNKRRGNLVRTYTVFGIKFKEGGGWYLVKSEAAKYLRMVTQDGHPDSTSVFDVCTREEAVALEAREAQEKMERRASPHSPHGADRPRNAADVRTRHDPSDGVLTTRDLPRHRSMSPADE